MKKKLFSVLSLSALAMTAMSLTGCGISDEELFERNTQYILLSDIGPAGAGADYKVQGELKAATAFTDEFIEKGGKVSWSSNNTDIIDAYKFNEGALTVPINMPDFGSETAEVKITATVTMGSSFKKDVQWKLYVDAKKIENESLSSLIKRYFYAREGNIGDNNAYESPIKKTANGKNMIALCVKLENDTARNTIKELVPNNTYEEYVANSASNRRYVNILQDTDNAIVAAAKEDIKGTLNLEVSGKTVYNSIKEIAETGKLNGVELSTSDKNAITNLKIVELINTIIDKLGSDADGLTKITVA